MADRPFSLIAISDSIVDTLSAPPGASSIETYTALVQTILSATTHQLELSQQQRFPSSTHTKPTSISPLQLLLPLSSLMRQLPFSPKVIRATLLSWVILSELHYAPAAQRTTRLQRWRLLCRSQPMAICDVLISHYPAVLACINSNALAPPTTLNPLLRWMIVVASVIRFSSVEQRFARLQQLLLRSIPNVRDTLTLNGFLGEHYLVVGLLNPFAALPCSHQAVTKIPPTSLRELLSALAAEDVDPDYVIQWCQQHAEYAPLLLACATDANRLGLVVTDIKHAILTYGVRRVGDILIQQTLQSQLLGLYFPLRAWCLQFMRLSTFIAVQLCASSEQYQGCQQQAELLLTLACSGLFTHSAILTSSRPPSVQCLPFLPFHAPATRLQRQLRSISTTLAQHWQVNNSMLSALDAININALSPSHDRLGFALILHLSLLWTQQWFINGAMHSLSSSRTQEQNALLQLGIASEEKSVIQMKASSLLLSPLA